MNDASVTSRGHLCDSTAFLYVMLCYIAVAGHLSVFSHRLSGRNLIATNNNKLGIWVSPDCCRCQYQVLLKQAHPFVYKPSPASLSVQTLVSDKILKNHFFAETHS